ncbi:uncharacterized protein LOC119307203 [Triticum dicoccoides]|uniref:PDZ domain-containing protein n=2 Tax=Triticum TaxID=4564 RepID=A0A9R1AGB8_TRITD|nr:uncharacterized protein LOC119307203 [Triticum dicoccoides]XP_044386652.1 uncharacterized protein LOC123110242 [Triticum aestivum]VAI26875.1 unnamed protein product [Triticum turgidum subsp. durum]
MSRAVRIRGDELETTEREAKRRSVAEEGEGTALHSTSPRSPGELAVRTSHPEIHLAIFEPNKAQSEAKQDRVYDVVESVAEESSDPPSPPIYQPYIPDELVDDLDVLADFEDAKAKYEAERDRRANLFTMEHHCYKAASSLFKTHRLLPILEQARDATLLAAKSVILLSSFVESDPLNKCSGLWFERDDHSKTALVLTSAQLIREKKEPKNPFEWKVQWTGNYHRQAEVIVHLLDNTAVPARLLYLQEHYEFAIYKVQVDKPVQLATFTECVRSGQDVFRLGRDESLNLSITHGMVAYKIPSWYERCHYMYLSCDPSSPSLLRDDGGPIIDLEGKVVGLVNNHIKETFIPSFLLHKCLDFWRRFNCMPRLHLGMTFTSIKHLDPSCIERMTRNHNIESGLIVEQVSKGSHAEKIGIREGDVIESFNGKYISTTIELEQMLIDICWDHFDQRKELYAEKDVSVKIFDAIKQRRRTRNLTAIVSDLGEDIVEGTYPIMRKEAMPVS